ncbi:hypothetical protein PGT21_014708 [Puccinia graminis f. sp. tritici]|uniref:Uncharacterized protein n=1 Tax=Puccinia graminis f. sp. tritici TaxID=56615 RepID=A0A5B0S3D7_PUCGR|nr:hypothetical protein PGT21_014708 [Puccinia graminis f. sp. tritici]KAA1131573.1 hypothetical protein PGTUg99_031680 [Puccinia graminis f. sp. tritici]
MIVGLADRPKAIQLQTACYVKIIIETTPSERAGLNVQDEGTRISSLSETYHLQVSIPRIAILSRPRSHLQLIKGELNGPGLTRADK